MAGAFGLDFKSVKFFFDAPKVKSSLDKFERRVLTRTGAFGRKVMRNSIRKRPQNYTAVPPYPRYRAHSNSGLRLIFFVYSPSKGSVIIGPVKFRTKDKVVRHNRTEETRRNNQTVPQLLNEGGTVGIRTVYKSGNTYTRVIGYRKFPFATLAFNPTLKFMKKVIQEEELK